MATQTEVSYVCDLCEKPARHIGVQLQVGTSKTKADLCGVCMALFDGFRELIDKLPGIGTARRG